MKWLRRLLVVTGIAAIGIVVTAGAVIQTDDDIYFAIKKNLTIFGSLYEELAVGYVDPINPEQLMRTGFESMLGTLDPYTVFIDEATNEDIDIATRGRYAGVGLSVAMNDGRITVINPIEGYSGFKQGVRSGDVIVEVDGRSVVGMTPQDVSSILRGDPGSAVSVVVEREGEQQPVEFLLTREQVKVKNVSYADVIDGTSIGYIRLERFGRGAYNEVNVAVRTLLDERNASAIILDLRDNPGGLLEAAVDISGIFVPQGTEIVSTRGRLQQSHRSYRSRKAPIDAEIPVAIVVNGNSASASEIVAGAIQDLDRGIIVGERTFGKGLVQIVRPLPYNTSLKMTTSKYYTPSGRSIQAINYTHRAEDGYAVAVADSLQRRYRTRAGREVRSSGGIAPDLGVELSQMSDFERALIRKSAFFRFANSFAAENDTVPEDFEVTDDVLDQFRTWLDEDGFVFEGQGEFLLDELEAEAAASGYDLEDEIDALRNSVEREQDRDFDRYRNDLAEGLRQEILARYHGDTAQIRASLSFDEQVRATVDLLEDSRRIGEILKGDQ